MFVYFDNSATTKPSPEAVEAVTRCLTEEFGNPSSLYGLGLQGEKILKEAKENVAQSLGCSTSEVFFTSCGTESDNWVLKGVWEAKHKQGRRIITTEVEHPAVLRCCDWLKQQGADVVYLPAGNDGKISLKDFEAALNSDTILVSVMHVNNETGAVMPIKEIRELMVKKGVNAYLHTDAVQSYGKLDCNVKNLGVDFMSISGHKVHAPKGVGALYIKKGVHLPVYLHGGGQEGGQRSGTENLASIAALGVCAKHIAAERQKDLEQIKLVRDTLLKAVTEKVPDIRINSPEDACPSVLNLSLLGCRGEVLLHMLDTEGVCVSTGSACSSHVKGSHVLSAMGLKPNEIEGALRFSFSAYNTVEEALYAAEVLSRLAQSHRKLMKYHRG